MIPSIDRGAFDASRCFLPNCRPRCWGCCCCSLPSNPPFSFFRFLLRLIVSLLILSPISEAGANFWFVEPRPERLETCCRRTSRYDRLPYERQVRLGSFRCLPEVGKRANAEGKPAAAKGRVDSAGTSERRGKGNQGRARLPDERRRKNPQARAGRRRAPVPPPNPATEPARERLHGAAASGCLLSRVLERRKPKTSVLGGRCFMPHLVIPFPLFTYIHLYTYYN